MKQVGFLHSLTAQKLEAYKKELQRKGYIVTESDPIFIAYRKEKKIIALSTNSIENNFGIASLRAWHDLEKKRFSPQDFRSFVQTALENAGINPNIIAPVLGHKAHGIDFHYSEHDITHLMRKFRTALPYLLPESIENLKAETQKEIAEEKKKVNNLEYDNNSLKKEANKIASEKETLKMEIGSLQKRVDDIAFSLQKQTQIRIRKQQNEAEATEAKEQAEIRDTDNLSGKEEKAPSQVKEHWASEEHWQGLTEEEKDLLRKHLKTKDEKAQ